MSQAMYPPLHRNGAWRQWHGAIECMGAGYLASGPVLPVLLDVLAFLDFELLARLARRLGAAFAKLLDELVHEGQVLLLGLVGRHKVCGLVGLGHGRAQRDEHVAGRRLDLDTLLHERHRLHRPHHVLHVHVDHVVVAWARRGGRQARRVSINTKDFIV